MSPIQKRLRPLMIADFFAGLMFFYPVTFPFMHHVGLTAAQMSTYALVSSVVVLAIEIPSGILADRWSRKNIVIIGLLSIGTGAALLSQAHNFEGFLVGAIFISAYFAMRSGIQEAMIYDVLLEQDQRIDYEHQLGKLRVYATAGNVISSLLGALLAAVIGFRFPYYLSCVSCALAIFFLYHFREPQLHRKIGATKFHKHVSVLFRSLSQHKDMKLLVITSIFLGIEFNYMLQVDPLWPVALGLATVWFGPLNAFLLSSQGVAAPVAKRIANSSKRIQLLALVLVLTAAGLLIRNIFIIALSEFALLATATTLMVVLSGRIQDQLPSSQRSGVGSAISTFSTLAFVISLAVFTVIAKSHSVFTAAWILVITAVLAALFMKSSLLTTSHQVNKETY